MCDSWPVGFTIEIEATSGEAITAHRIVQCVRQHPQAAQALTSIQNTQAYSVRSPELVCPCAERVSASRFQIKTAFRQMDSMYRNVIPLDNYWSNCVGAVWDLTGARPDKVALNDRGWCVCYQLKWGVHR